LRLSNASGLGVLLLQRWLLVAAGFFSVSGGGGFVRPATLRLKMEGASSAVLCFLSFRVLVLVVCTFLYEYKSTFSKKGTSRENNGSTVSVVL
jgi:nitrate/nitrite transporter NarK